MMHGQKNIKLNTLICICGLVIENTLFEPWQGPRLLWINSVISFLKTSWKIVYYPVQLVPTSFTFLSNRLWIVTLYILRSE